MSHIAFRVYWIYTKKEILSDMTKKWKKEKFRFHRKDSYMPCEALAHIHKCGSRLYGVI